MELELITQNITLIISVALAISEGLALIPQVKSNSIFTLVVNILKTMAGKGE